MKFTIYRGSWVRGGIKNNNKYGESNLLNDKNRMCCLGQVCYQAGVPLSDLSEIGNPYEIVDTLQDKVFEIGLSSKDMDYKGRFIDTSLTEDCIFANDAGSLTDKEREADIKSSFKAAGHKVVFKNGVAPWLQESV